MLQVAIPRSARGPSRGFNHPRDRHARILAVAAVLSAFPLGDGVAASPCRSMRVSMSPVAIPQARRAKLQASSAMGLAVFPDATACALDAVPASTRLAIPCRMAAMRNML
jgi:hypothetical protein